MPGTAGARTRRRRSSTTPTDIGYGMSAAPEVPTGQHISASTSARRSTTSCGSPTSRMTRAQSHLVLWWAPTTNTPTAPLHRLLLHDDPSTVAPTTIRVPNDANARAAFDAIAAGSNGGLAIESVDARPAATWSPAPAPQSALAAAVLDRPLDLGWRRTSYSALTAAAHDAPRLGSEPEISQKDDETDLADLPSLDPSDRRPAARRAVAVGLAHRRRPVRHPRTQCSRGARPPDNRRRRTGSGGQAGRPQRSARGHRRADRRHARRPGNTSGRPDRRRGAAGHQELRSPARAGLRDAAGRWRHARRAARVLLADLVPLWREHCPDGPLAPYADALAALDPTPLRGYLSGSIDAVFRDPGRPGTSSPTTRPTGSAGTTSRSPRGAIAPKPWPTR